VKKRKTSEVAFFFFFGDLPTTKNGAKAKENLSTRLTEVGG
jgi:hypothetical protein